MTSKTAPAEATPTAVDTGTNELLAERDGAVLILTLNRPERLNAISGPMPSALSRVLVDANKDPRFVRSSSRARDVASAPASISSTADLPRAPGASLRSSSSSTCTTPRLQHSGTWTSR